MLGNLQKTTFIICISSCIGGIFISSVVGFFYPNYSHLRNNLSQLGVSIIPVASVMTIWWVLLGSLLILLGKVIENCKYFKLTVWFVVFYEIGKRVYSSLFPVDYSNNRSSLFSKLHIILISGIGVLAVLLLPIILQKVFMKNLYPQFYVLSCFTIFVGLFFIVLLSIAKMYDDPSIFISSKKGFWQRLISLDFYIYFVSLSFVILKLDRKGLS